MGTKSLFFSLLILGSAITLSRAQPPALVADGKEEGAKYCASLVTEHKNTCMKAVSDAKYISIDAINACRTNNPWDVDKSLCMQTIKDGRYQVELALVCADMPSNLKITCMMYTKDKSAKAPEINACTQNQFWKEDILNCLKEIVKDAPVSTPTPSPSASPTTPSPSPHGSVTPSPSPHSYTCKKTQIISEMDAILELLKSKKTPEAVKKFEALEKELKECLT